MNIQQLRCFVTAARVFSFTEAARILGVSRQAVAMSIQNLENEYGIRLFIRNGNRVVLSSEGQELLEKASHTVLLFDSIAGSFNKSGTHSLTIGIDSILINPKTRFMPVVTTYREVKGGCDITIGQIAYNRAINSVQSSSVDACLVRALRGSTPQLERTVLRKRYLALVVAQNNPLSRLDTIDFHDLKYLPFVARNDESNRYKESGEPQQLFGFDINIIARVDEQALLQEILEGKEVATLGVVFEAGCKEYEGGLCRIPITGLANNCIEDAFIYRSDSALRAQIEHFISYICRDNRWEELHLSS